MSVFSNPASSTQAETAAYVAALLGLIGNDDPVRVLAQTPAALERLLASLSPETVTKPEAPGKWSIRHVLAHLADSDLVWGWRLRLILAQERPPLTGYDQDAWASRLGYANADPRESVEMFSVLRMANLRLIGRAVPEDLQRVGVHVERGDESLAHHLKLYAGHDLLHLNQIERIRQAVS